MRIRSRLLLLMLAVLAPALLATAIAVAYIYGEEQDFHRASLRETARALALALDREMWRREAVLRTLAASPLLQRRDYATFYELARRVASETDGTIILSDLRGRQLLNTALPLGAPLPDMLPQERQLRERVGNERTLVSNVYVPPANLGSHSFAIQVPVRRGDQVVQLLTLAALTGQLQSLLSEQQLPAGWHASIVDPAGVVAARSSEPEAFVGKPVRADLQARMASSDEGFHEGTTLAGVPGTAFYARAPQSRWLFLVSVPNQQLHGAGRRAAQALAAASLLLLGLGLGAALVVGRRIARSVEMLRATADRLGIGGPVRPPASGIEELDAVARALAEADQRLSQSKVELEQRVAQALQDYETSQRALLQAQKLEALGRLTGGIAHDFNNVLQTLTGALHTLRQQADPAQRELLARCERAVARGTELARQLMAFGRVQDVRSETLDTGAWLLEARTLLDGALPANVTLDYDLMPGLWPVTVDPAQLELALLNLVMNARDAMPAGGDIVLRGGNEQLAAGPELPAGDYVVLTLADTGEGMSPEVAAHALDPFFTTKSVGRGSGMGLPQAYGFARQHGGTLTLDSRPGHGTTVRMYLPRSQQLPTATLPRAPSLPALPASNGKVLLVEDDELVRETVSTALQAAGFEIHAAATADEALQRLDGGERFDAVLTDVVMPGTLNGIELAEYILRHHPGTGVIVATGYSDRRFSLPGVRTLPKPYDLRQAVDALNQAIGG